MIDATDMLEKNEQKERARIALDKAKRQERQAKCVSITLDDKTTILVSRDTVKRHGGKEEYLKYYRSRLAEFRRSNY